MPNLDKRKIIFGTFFLLANKLQMIGDQFLGEDGMTTRQWFLTIMVNQFSQAPTLTAVAELMGSSHQNVKQLALKLEAKGFLKIARDPEDARALRLHLTEKSRAFWARRTDKDNAFIRDLFESIDEQELEVLYDGIGKLVTKVEKMKRTL